MPEKLIAGDPEFYLRAHLKTQSGTLGIPSEPQVREYLRCFDDPAAIQAICEDYRASAGVDLVLDRHDLNSGNLLTVPLLAIWVPAGLWAKRMRSNVNGSAFPAPPCAVSRWTADISFRRNDLRCC